MNEKIIISGVGCCLVDRLYNNISFNSSEFSEYLSKEKGDGGLTPGHLVLQEEFEKFSCKDFMSILPELIGNRPPEKINIGGPCIVALIHAAQITSGQNIDFRFYGCGGKDDDGDFLMASLVKTPVDISHYHLTDTITPSTIVLSDPTYDCGNGERIFINSIGAAWELKPENLDNDFFASDIVVFGGTALVPAIHDDLEELLQKAKSNSCFTIVNTVFDFRNEKTNPLKKWPLGKTDGSYRNIDLLITDHDEAIRLSGKSTLDEACTFFKEQDTGAVVITNGAKNITLYSLGQKFEKLPITTMPISEAVSIELRKGKVGDTTGCGDNFAGGVIASAATQLQAGEKVLDLKEACRWGIVSGGFACFYVGGTWFEKHPGEKRELIQPYYEYYKKQIEDGK